MRLGIDKDHAYAWSRTRNAPHSRIPKIQYQSVSKRRLANRSESNSNHYNYPTTAQEERLSIHAGDLHGTQPITLRTAVYETRTYGGVRGALRQFLAEPSTRLWAGCFVKITIKP
ncbi:hypothetical protein SAMN04488131_11399 [Flavobacterium xueshanense]|uniref:Uncharacterized protein n=2 Tax=Flavobacterium xueshanense TaxID=935223 RepID=A0A1I2HCJ0_9FLAO|nr:hypothetical protein SAMN04488131_11399 [Flavobacterium xueshanense]